MDYKDYKFSEDKDGRWLDGSRVLQVKDSPCSTSPRSPGRYLRAGLPQCAAPGVPGTAEEGLGRQVWCQGMHFSAHHSTQQLTGKGMQ